MNQDVFAGRWKQLRGQAKEWWGQVTDDELDQIEGQRDKLAGLLQVKYGYTKEQAEQEIDRRIDRAA
ncbi:MAG: CsbD family protein [Candidatus Rokubacteria bacterium]|nr:CsbD family protein [Candidatus Rokubacteria bacterium]